MRSVALDVHKDKLVLSESRDGAIVARATGRHLLDLEKVLGPDTPRARVAFEACRSAWVLHDSLQAWGHEPLILDTTRIRRIGVGQHGRKNDKIDADVMARALESNYIHLAHVLSPGRREIRRVLATRHGFVASRTQHVNIVRGLALSEGVEIACCDTDHFARHASAAAWSETTRRQLTPTLALIEQLTRAVHDATHELHEICSREPVVALLATAPFVGLIVAATFVSVIDEAGRFRDAHHVASYLGMVPSENSSNSLPRLGAITKAGNTWARAALIESAAGILDRGKSDDPLVLWGRAVSERRGKFIARVAVARRLAGILWAMWKYDRPYDPKRLAAQSSLGLEEHARQLHAQSESMETLAPEPELRDQRLSRAQRKLRGAFSARKMTQPKPRATDRRKTTAPRQRRGGHPTK